VLQLRVSLAASRRLAAFVAREHPLLSLFVTGARPSPDGYGLVDIIVSSKRE